MREETARYAVSPLHDKVEFFCNSQKAAEVSGVQGGLLNIRLILYPLVTFYLDLDCRALGIGRSMVFIKFRCHLTVQGGFLQVDRGRLLVTTAD
ncbi:MAG: hypothetical protein J0H48_11780 [Nitrosospira multiformis]|nr:hypothetical protein [Nitrosospira multiformis]